MNKICIDCNVAETWSPIARLCLSCKKQHKAIADKAYGSTWAANNPEKVKAKRNRYIAKNVEKVRAEKKRVQQAYRLRIKSDPVYRAKRYAHDVVLRKIKQGILTKPDSCSECDVSIIEAHHHNGYDEKHILDVVWLCRYHHKQRHPNKRIHEPTVGMSG